MLALGAAIPNGTEVYLALLHALNRLANRVTAIVQNGTLAIYAGVVLTTAAVLPGIALLGASTGRAGPTSSAVPDRSRSPSCSSAVR